MDDLQIRTTLKLTDVHLAGIAAGRDIDRGAFDLQADPEGLHLAGQATLAGIPVQLGTQMDFRAGPPTQVLETISLSGTATDAQRAALGLAAPDLLRGPVAASAKLVIRRDQRAEAAIAADLTGAVLAVAPLGYQKPPGEPARLSARILLDHDRITGIDRLAAEGTTLHLAGSVSFAQGQPEAVRLTRLALGSETEAEGTVRLPHRPGEAWAATLSGRSIDLSALLKRTPPPPGDVPRQEPPPGPPYQVEARFDRVVLGPDRHLLAIAARIENDGRVMRRLHLVGRTAANQPFELTIEPDRGGRRLTGSTSDAGGLLRALEGGEKMIGGQLQLSGNYDDIQPGHPLSGIARIDDFRIRNAPLMARLLQGMTLYGLVEAVQGPGLGFTRLMAPFRFSNSVLELNEARAFNASLGMTAQGRIDLGRQALDLEGTIVPAYFFNSLLGKLPLVGRLFSPERGGGVFAATYTARGPIDDPHVGVNPLAALTPGFLRGFFGLFTQPGSEPGAPPPQVGQGGPPSRRP